MAFTIAPIIMLPGPVALGVTSFGPMTPSLGATNLQVSIARAGLSLLTQTLDWTLELSGDAGISWSSWSASTVAGVVKVSKLLDPLESIATESVLAIAIPMAVDANTRLRGSITTREFMVTTVTVKQS